MTFQFTVLGTAIDGLEDLPISVSSQLIPDNNPPNRKNGLHLVIHIAAGLLVENRQIYEPCTVRLPTMLTKHRALGYVVVVVLARSEGIAGTRMSSNSPHLRNMRRILKGKT